MKRSFFVLLLTTILFANCKNLTEEQIVNKDTKKTKEEPPQLEILFSFKTNKTDVFKIIMNNIEVDELQKKNIQIMETVSPTSQFDNITAKFGQGNISKNIAFNLGNKEVKEVIFDKINISYKNKFIDISTIEDMTKLLRFSQYIEIDSVSKTLKTKKVKNKHYPVFYFSKNLLNRLNKD